MAISLSSGGTGNDKADALAAKYAPSLFGLPGKDPITGDQALKAYQYLAESGSPLWADIRQKLLSAGQYGALSTKEKQHISAYNWTTYDKNGVGQAITNLYIYNKQAPAPIPLTQFVAQQATSTKNNGLSGAKALTPISIPSTPDLNNVVIKAFTSVTGRNPTAQEEASFTKQFQDLAMSYAVGKKAGKSAQVFAQPTPATLANPAQTTENLPTPPAGFSAVQQLPDPTVAAENFASNVAGASVATKGISDAVGQWLGNLGNGVLG